MRAKLDFIVSNKSDHTFFLSFFTFTYYLQRINYNNYNHLFSKQSLKDEKNIYYEEKMNIFSLSLISPGTIG